DRACGARQPARGGRADDFGHAPPGQGVRALAAARARRLGGAAVRDRRPGLGPAAGGRDDLDHAHARDRRGTMTRLLLASLPAWATLAVALLFLASPVLSAECVLASWYGAESGNRTANGERFDGSSMTAAHRSLPFGTKLRVSYRGKSVEVRVNDRGPFIKGR